MTCRFMSLPDTSFDVKKIQGDLDVPTYHIRHILYPLIGAQTARPNDRVPIAKQFGGTQLDRHLPPPPTTLAVNVPVNRLRPGQRSEHPTVTQKSRGTSLFASKQSGCDSENRWRGVVAF